MRHKHRVESHDDILGGNGSSTVGFRTGFAVPSIGGRAPSAIEHRIDENPPSAKLENERRAANQGDLHPLILGDSRRESPAILRYSDEQPHHSKRRRNPKTGSGRPGRTGS